MSVFRRFAAAAIGALALGLTALPATATAYLQCVPFARAESGVDIRGNALTWWDQAAGRYDRGRAPREGAVMAFAPTRSMPIGHVAVVSRIISDREILISHSNWSPINGRRGQIERNVRAIDVSPSGDWSQVRVWYAPIRDLGTRVNPIRGFIYPSGARSAPAQPTIASPSTTLAAIAASVAADS